MTDARSMLRYRVTPLSTLALVAIAFGACSRDESMGVTADGTVELTQIDVAPFVSGRVARVVVEEGAVVHRGDTLVPPTMLGPLLTGLLRRKRDHDEAFERITRLTVREREVLALLAQGSDNDSIARALVISPQTARTHIQNILGKLGVHSRLEAAAFVTRSGMLQNLVRAEGVNA